MMNPPAPHAVIQPVMPYNLVQDQEMRLEQAKNDAATFKAAQELIQAQAKMIEAQKEVQAAHEKYQAALLKSNKDLKDRVKALEPVSASRAAGMAALSRFGGGL